MRRRKSNIKRKVKLILIVFLVVIVGGKVGESIGAKAYEIYHLLTWEQSEEWELILVNDKHPLPEHYTVNLVEAEPGKYVEERIYDYLNEMFAAAREEGVYPIIRDAYRSKEEQQRIMKNKVTAYKNEGYPEFLARRYAKEWVAEPGKSEHQLGLAVDINAEKTLCTNEMVYAWLEKNAHQYGFILRYPLDKENITNTAYEPWHYRFVGIEAASKMYEKNLCLEEYVE